jgi:hypothetical protein
MPIVEPRRSLPHFFFTSFNALLFASLKFSPLSKLDFIIDMPQTSSLQITTRPKISCALGSGLFRLALEESPKTTLSPYQTGYHSDGSKWILRIVDLQARCRPPSAQRKQVQEFIRLRRGMRSTRYIQDVRVVLEANQPLMLLLDHGKTMKYCLVIANKQMG